MITLRPLRCAAVVAVACCLSSTGFAQSGSASGADGAAAPAALPLWAYPVNPPRAAGRPAGSGAAATAPAADAPVEMAHVAGSTAEYPKKDLSGLYLVPDWFPEMHPKMPPIVAEGRKPDIGACGHCHLPTGFGRPENVSVAGLPAAYMMGQIEDFKNDLRKSSEPRMGSVALMAKYTKSMTPEETKAAVEYFAGIKYGKWIRVVETDMVPKTHPMGGMMVADEGTEPIGERVIELSEDLEQFELRNPKVGFVAYVPKGSLKAGEALVKTGGAGKTMACTTCHGANLKGVGNIPSIAGRSPSQMTRQLIDFQTGARNGAVGQMMKMPVAKLTVGDIVAITGYLGSLEP